MTHKKHSWNETIRTVLIALLLAMTFRSLAFEPFHIPSGSMKSNLLVGDYLFVSKYAYGYSRYSFPFGFKFFDGRVLETKPKRGDVVVFRLPSNPRIDFIKRLMGLPGDSVQVRDGITYINGTPLARTPLDTWQDVDEQTGEAVDVPRLVETLPEGKEIKILKQYKYSQGDDTKIFIVPEGHYFMMGDNRDNSRDSRFDEVSFVPEANLVGRAEIIFFSTSPDKFGDGGFKLDFLNPFSWRFERFFNLID